MLHQILLVFCLLMVKLTDLQKESDFQRLFKKKKIPLADWLPSLLHGDKVSS